MNFCLVNACSDPRVTQTYLLEVADALEQQLGYDWAPMYQAAPASVQVSALGTIPDGFSPITLYDALPDDPQAVADHEVSATSAGLPTGRVSVTSALQEDPDIFVGITVAISHEVLEAITDPYANQLAIQEDGTLWMLECCDPVQGDSYKIGRASVSNFVGPRFFRLGPGPYDKLGLLNAPWAIRPNGYAVKGDDLRTLAPVFGEKMSADAQARALAKHRMQRMLAA